jgi:hypothetical protein
MRPSNKSSAYLSNSALRYALTVDPGYTLPSQICLSLCSFLSEILQQFISTTELIEICVEDMWDVLPAWNKRSTEVLKKGRA